MTPATLHKIYLGAIAGVLLIGGVVADSAIKHARDDATRDAVISQQKSNISDLEKKIVDAKSDAQAKIAALEKQKQQVAASPAKAVSVIHDVLPNVPDVKPDLPNAPQPQMTLTPDDQQNLAQFILSCKQCSVERDQLQSQVGDQQKVIDAQKVQLSAAVKASKGGSVWQRTKSALKYIGIGGAIGFAVAKAH